MINNTKQPETHLPASTWSYRVTLLAHSVSSKGFVKPTRNMWHVSDVRDLRNCEKVA